MIQNVAQRNTNSFNDENRYFEYEGGSILFHFDPTECGLTEPRFHPTNVVFFANDEAHALDILKRFLEWFVSKGIGEDHCGYRPSLIKHYLENFDKVKVEAVPNNIFMNVDWAGNSYFA